MPIKNQPIKEILLFRRMITPYIIQALFWLLVLLSILVAIENLIHAHYKHAVEALILGPLAARIGAEILLLGFRMLEALKKIKTYPPI